jgi:hypothetical protein
MIGTILASFSFLSLGALFIFSAGTRKEANQSWKIKLIGGVLLLITCALLMFFAGWVSHNIYLAEKILESRGECIFFIKKSTHTSFNFIIAKKEQ